MELKEAKRLLIEAESKITELLNNLEEKIGGTVIGIDVSTRQLEVKGKRIPYSKINFEL